MNSGKKTLVEGKQLTLSGTECPGRGHHGTCAIIFPMGPKEKQKILWRIDNGLTHFWSLLSLLRGSKFQHHKMDGSCFTTLTLLLLFPSVHLSLSLECSSTQYSRPINNPNTCCNKCSPGTYMEKRDDYTCEIQCLPCTGERYTNTYNARSCIICDHCTKENMEEDSPCNSTHNTVCRCKAGFTCGDIPCSYCKKSPTTTAPPTTARRTTAVSPKPIQDTVWFMIIICLLCLGIVLVIVTKIKPLLNWFSHNKWYCKKKLSVPVTVFIYDNQEEEGEEASTPIQEKGDKLMEV